jgi:predicted TIM-barrel fold metal-dependent hydrolase
MAPSARRQRNRIRAQLDHPVIDSDGHLYEFTPGVFDRMREIGGPGIVDRVAAQFRSRELEPDLQPVSWYDLSPEERRDRRIWRPVFWANPTKNTVDRATSLFPALLYERLAEIGLDFVVLYPTVGLMYPHLAADEERIVACRALNEYHAEAFGPYRDRIAPVAMVPMHTPQEGIGELERAVALGYKVIAIPSWVSRPVKAAAHEYPGSERIVRWLDTYGMDSEYDYDPFWQRCVDLRVAVGAHSQGFGSAWGGRRSISSYLYNHMGHFADSGEALTKSLFLGGVTARFPTLRFAILEGGISWAVRLFGDLLSHWDKRNVAALANYDPANVDRSELRELLHRFGRPQIGGRDPEVVLDAIMPGGLDGQRDRELIDEWSSSKVGNVDDIIARFPEGFSFGCEADDPLVAMAFRARELFGAALRPVFSSDIGHWDVPDMMVILDEAFEQVQHGYLTPDEFRDFTFTNAVRLYAGSNPSFFAGTALEQEVLRLSADRVVERTA